MFSKRFVLVSVTLVMASVWLGACGDETAMPPAITVAPQATATSEPPTPTQPVAPETPVPSPTITPTSTAIVPSSTPSENINDYTISNPGNVLIDPVLRRQYLETLSSIRQKDLCIADPYLWEWGGEVYQVVELSPVIYFERESADDNDTLRRLRRAMMVLAAEYLGTNNDEAAIAIIDTLRIWASANALSSLGGSNFVGTVYDVKNVVTPTLASYSLVRNHPYLSAEDQALIENWLEMLVRQLDVDLTDNNHSYMRFAILMEWGALMDDEAYFQKGVDGYINALGQMRPDGSFPEETARGAMATTYTSHAISSLVLMAEIAANQEHNLYDLEQNNLSLHSAITFLLDAIDDPDVIIGYAAANDTCTIPEGCGDYRKQYLLLNMGWIEAYRARFPESENTKRINKLFEDMVLDYSRWQVGENRAVMIYPNPLDGAATRCLYSKIDP